MADEAQGAVTTAQEAPAGEIIRGTEAEIYKRLSDEPGFFDVYTKAHSEGRIEITDKPTTGEPAPVPEAKAEPAPAAVEAKPEPKPAEAVDEDITVTLKKSQLGTFKTIGEKLKSADEAQALVNFLKTETARVKGELEAGTATTDENARLKQELADLKAKTTAATTEATKKVEEVVQVKPDAKVLDDMVTFDDFEGLDKEAMEAKLFEAETQTRIIKGIKQTAEVAKYAKALEKTTSELKAELAALKTDVADTKKKQTENETRQAETTKQKEQELENEKLFASISEFQTRTPDLKTQLPLKELNAKYIDFVGNLKLAISPKTQRDLEDALTRYFYDETEIGDKLRADCTAKGIVPPEENDKFLQIMDIKRIAESTKLPLDEAYAAYKVRNKIKAPDPAEQQRIQAAIEQRLRSAATMDSSKIQSENPVDMGEDQTVQAIIEKFTPSEMKKDDAVRQRVDAFCTRNGFPLYDWAKYN